MLFENRAIVYICLDSPVAWLAWFPLDMDSPPIEKYSTFQINVNSVCENNVTCEDQPCGPGSSCTQLDQGYICHCAPGYGGINCNNDSRIDQVFLVEEQTAIINSPGYRIKHIESEQYVWRVTGKPGCGIGILTLDFELADGLLKVRTSPSEYSVMTSFQGNPRPYVYADYSVIWLEFWSSDSAYVLPEQRGFSLELSIQCYNMSNDVCYRSNPCGPRSDCSAFDGGYYCLCDTWYSGVNCLEERRPVVVVVPDSVDEVAVISPGSMYPPATDFLWRIDADLGCSIGAYFAKLKINYYDVLTILLTPPSLRDVFYQFSQNDFAYFFVESSHLWLEFKSGLRYDRMAELSMLVQCRYDTEVTRCESQGPCYTGSFCTDSSFGYVCMCPPGYTGINCENDTYVTHLHLSKDEDRHLQYSRTDPVTTERNIWQVHGTPHCAVGVSTNRQDFGRITSLRFLWAFNIDTTFALYTLLYLDTCYMYIASSEIVIQIDFEMVFTNSAHFELDLETQCTSEVLSCEDSPCSEGSSCLDQDYGFICRCFPGFTGTNCSQGNEVRHIDLEMDRPLVLDLPEYLGYMPPYPQMSWFVQGIERYTIGVSVQPPSCPFCTSLTMNAEPTQSGFMVESTGSVFVLLNHSSIWLSCPEHTCTIYGAAVHEISIQPLEDLSPDPCQKAECSSSSECHTLDIGGYVCYCRPGFHGVQCRNDSGAHKVFVNSSESVAIPSLSLPMSTPADTTTYVQTIPGCGIGIVRTKLQAWPWGYVLHVRSDTANHLLLRLDGDNTIYDQYHFLSHHAVWIEIYGDFKVEFSLVNVTSQCNEGKTASCKPNSCEHGSLCTSIHGGGYSCLCQVGFAGIRCTDELAVGHIEVNASAPGTLHLLASEFVHPYQAWRVEVTEGCNIGIDFRHLRIFPSGRFTIKDNLTAPTINQSYTDALVKDMYINFPKHVLWFQYEEIWHRSTLHIVLYESCVKGNCSLGVCTVDSICEDFYDGYSCDCIPGFGGVNCAADVGVREWILNPSQELDLESLEENITCKVEVPDQGCGMELFINHNSVVVEGPRYLSLIVQSSVSKSTFLTASEGKFNEYAYFDLSTVWFQLYVPLGIRLTSRVSMSARCDSFLSELNCSSTPCSVHSDCFDHAAGYKCVCHPGYKGVNCSEVMEKAEGLIEYVHANNTNMNVTVCVEYQTCSYMGCGQQMDPIEATFGCSCDDACEHFGDCCFDYPSTCQNGVERGNFGAGFGYGGFGISGFFDPFESEEEEFDMPVSIHPNMFSCVPTVKWNYLFVSQCPPQWNSSDSRARCEGAADFSDPLTFIPVSLGTKVTFRNVYCAVCHGVHPSNLTSWPIDFHCGGDNQRSDLGVMWDRIRRGICNYTIDDPGFPDKPAYRPCSVDMINDCPNDFADSGITEACAEFHAPLKPLDKQSTFSNGYCLECNLPGYSYSPFFPCLALQLVQNRPVAGFPLTVLVDFKGNNGIQVKVDKAVVSGKTMECQEGAVFDSLAGICRSLSCTDGYTLQDGECTWSVICDGNRVGIELSGFDVIDRECVSSQEMHYMMKCLADILELSLDDVSLVHANLEEHHCISHNMNDTISLEVHVKMTYSEIREIMADISRSDLCGALMLQFHVSCSDEEDMPCNDGWLSMDYGSYVSVSNTDQISHLTFRGVQATQRYHPSDIRRVAVIQRQQGNGSVLFLEMIQFCADMTENSTSPEIWDLPCPTITMNASEFRQLIIGNNTFMVHLKSGKQFNESEFTISDTGRILVCSFLLGNNGIANLTSDWFLQYSDTQSILSTVCVSLSLLCLSVTLATHLIFPSLRKLTNNKLVMMLCVFLLVAQLLTVVGSYASPIPLLCKIISVITHFCWIAVFAITNSLAFDLHLTFGYNRSFSFAQTSFKSLVRYIVYIPGVALCVVIPCVCIDSLTDSTVLDYTYGDLCWVGDDFMRFLSFGVPMAVLLAINVILFSYTALGIWKGYQNAKKVGRQNLRPSFQERFDLLKIYIKVSTLMGFTWTTAFIIPFTGITALWYLFIVLNGLQGVYIFLAFTATARVWSLFKAVVIGEPPSLSRKSKGTESTLRSDMSSRSAVGQGKVDDDLTVDLSTIRRWKEEKAESLKKTGASGM